MKCQNCGAELEDGVLFCRDCGSKVIKMQKRFCRECGHELAGNANFCTECGANANPFENKMSENIRESGGNVGQEVEAAPVYTKKNEKEIPLQGKKEDAVYLEHSNLSYEKDAGKKDISSRTASKKVFPIVVLAALIALALFVMVGRSTKSSKADNEPVVPADNVGQTDHTIKKGSQYAYMSDKWDVYIATAISDSILKVENWHKLLLTTEEMEYGHDIGTYKINDKNNGFSWLDEDHTAFTLIIQDKDNYEGKLRKATQVIFTININDNDKFKGSDYDESVSCYSYKNDDWHTYRAIPLTDHLIKIEAWHRVTAISSNYLYGYDVDVIDMENTDTDLEWTDDEHTCLTITMQDPANKYEWKEPVFAAFMLENDGCKFRNVKEYLESLGDESVTTEGTTDNQDGSVESVTNGNRPQRNGFDHTVTINAGLYDFAIPDYWKRNGSSEPYVAFAETGNKVSMLRIISLEDTEDQVGFEWLDTDEERQVVIESFFSGAAQDESTSDYTMESSDVYETDAFKGVIWTYNFKVKGIPSTGKVLLFPSPKNNHWVYVDCCYTNNTEYRYEDDFKRIVDSIKTAE